MYVAYGPARYQFDESEASITLSSRRNRSARNTPGTLLKTATISGTLINQAGTQSAMHTKIGALIDAFSEEGHDVGLYHDDDTPTHVFLDSSRSRTGVQVIVPPSWPKGEQVYATNFDFTIVCQAEFLDSETDQLLEFHETIRAIGDGGPDRVPVLLQSGLPDIQSPHLRTPTFAVQSGRAVGLQAYPQAPPMLWPQQKHGPGVVYTLDGPTRNGSNANAFEGFGVGWEYNFVGTEPFFGRRPHAR